LERIKNYSFLYCLLKQSGCRYVSFGYRYWNFIEDISEAERGSIIDFLKEKGLGEFIADHSKHKEYVVYGAGHDTLTLLKKTHFFAQSKLLFFVDDDSTKQDSEYCGYPVYSTEKLLKSDLPIFLPLVFIPRTVTPIREKLIKMGVSENRIIDGLML
jgi:FlaA1/EpsC-like NDP-sugar epimerase